MTMKNSFSRQLADICVLTGAAQQQKPVSEPPSRPRYQNTRRHTEMFFNHEVSQLPIRKPVQWLSARQALEPDSNLPEAHAQQGQQQPAQDDWLLGEAPPRPQAGRTRPRLSWATQHHNNTPAPAKRHRSQAPPEHLRRNGIPETQQRRQVPQHVAAPSNHQQPAEDPAAAEARRLQYLRNMHQIQRQEAEHEAQKARKAEAKSLSQSGQEVGYQDLNLETRKKRKAVSRPQPAVEASPQEIVLPPDVTVRQLAQLLGEHTSSGF